VENPLTDVRLETVDRLTPAQVAAVNRLVDDATEVDGVRPLSEHVTLHLRHGGDLPARNLLLWHQSASAHPAGGPHLAAYLHLDVTDPVEGPSAELVVAPGLRRHGFGRAVVARALELTGGQLRLWAHGDLPAAGLMAERLGFHRVRVLWQLRRSLFALLPAPDLPVGVTVRTFRPGLDDAAWLALNARAFAHHPEQGAWTLEDLRLRMSEHWFDPAGFFLAERGGELIGFHWTKAHGLDGHAHEPIGEVYVVGVDPSAQGLGLGRQLTVIGLQYLRALGLDQVMLYVDESNAPAIRLYESLGFSRWDTDVLFRHG